MPEFAAGVEAALDRALNEVAPPTPPLKPRKQKVVSPMPPDDSLNDILPMSLN